MLLRNRELMLLVCTYVGATLLIALASCALSGSAACFWVISTACILGIVVALFTRARYRAIALLAAQLDECLFAERPALLDGAREGELAILTNEIAKLLQKLAISVDQLERDRSLLADSLADISHQLKTPLTSLGLTTELLRKQIGGLDGLAADARRDALARVRTIERLQNQVMWLVSSLLKLARVDAGAIKLLHAPVDAEKLVEEAYGPLAIAFDIADVTFDRTIQPGSTFDGDQGWTAEALRNVLKNCLEHTPAGGIVSVRVQEDALAFRIVVTDTGPGIAAADLPHIFERFYRGADQADGADGVEPQGVGIGLALAKSLITAQDGRIRASNVTDETGATVGARFEIAFFKTAV